ncbi:MAG: ATP phosphoribosyltransferase regulatory subunit [Candidatus Cloacimonadaceae bacterium]
MKKPLSFHEIMPDDVWKWKYMESQIEQVLALFNYEEIRLSVLQDYGVLTMGITALLDNEEAQQITRQVINLERPDDKISLLSLRPEGTINVLNHVATRLKNDKIHRIYYHGPMFRKDDSGSPQEFYQLGVELLGSDSILSENEVISLGVKLCEQLGLKDAWLDITSFGCNSCRPLFFKAMRAFLNENKEKYCQTCYDELMKNPLLSTECLDKKCLHSTRQGPKMQDYLCPQCAVNFERVKKIQANLGYNYKVNHDLVKNFSYYNETVFNFVIQNNGSSEIIGGGGRYDYLSNKVTGKQIPAVGFYLNLDLIYNIITSRNLFHLPEKPFCVYVAAQSEEMEIIMLQIVQELHQSNISTLISSDLRSIDTDTKTAINGDCQAVVILRDDNIREGKAMLKNLVKDKQEYVSLSELLPELELIRKALQVTT